MCCVCCFVSQVDVNLLGVRVFMCQDFSRALSPAVSFSFLSHVSVELSSHAFAVPSTRPDIVVPAALLSDMNVRRPVGAVAVDVTSAELAIDTFVVGIHEAMGYDRCVDVTEPISLNVKYKGNGYQAMVAGSDSIVKR